MGRTYVKYSAVLIGMYLFLKNASGGGTLFIKGASGAATVVKSLQGR